MKKAYIHVSILTLLVSFFHPAKSQVIYTYHILPNPVAQGKAMKVHYKASGLTFNTGNMFIVELSDDTGSFNSPAVLDTMSSVSDNGTFTFKIPATQKPGSGYRIRVTSTDTAYTGSPNNENITIVRDYDAIRTDSLRRAWEYRFGGSLDDAIYAIKETNTGKFIMGGLSVSDSGGDKTQNTQGVTDYWLLLTDSVGNKIWDKDFGGADQEYMRDLQQTFDGGYILGGSSLSDSSGDKTQDSRGGNDYWIIKLDSAGNKVWDKTYGGSDHDNLESIQQTHDGGYIIGGYSKSGSSGDKHQSSRGAYDYWVVKTDSVGTIEWENRYGGSNDEGIGMAQETLDGGYIIGGYSNSGISGDKTQSSRGLYDYWIVKVDSAGNKLWDKRYGGTDNDYLTKIQQTPDSGYILFGNSSSGATGDKTQASRGGYDYWMVKINSTGTLEWDSRFGGSSAEEAATLTLTADGGYILGGASNSGKSGDRSQACWGNYDYWIVKVDSSGKKQWDQRYGGDDEDRLFSMVQTADGAYVMGGFSASGSSGDKIQGSHGFGDFWIFRLGFVNITTKLYTANVMCQASDIVVEYKTSGILLNKNNKFTVQLSDSNGSFTSHNNLRTKAGKLGDTMLVSLPGYIKAGGHYRIRVVSSDPYTEGRDNGIDIVIMPKPFVSFTINNDTQCFNTNKFLYTNSTTGGSTFLWNFGEGTSDTSTLFMAPPKQYAATGNYTVKLLVEASNGCKDSLSSNIKIYSQTSYTLTDTICQGQPLVINGKPHASTGTYYDTLVNSVGCDSLLTVKLTVIPSSTVTINAPICKGQSYTMNNKKYTFAGTYYDTLTNFAGCDSIITLNLTVNPVPIVNMSAGGSTTLCNGDSVLLTANGGSSYQWSGGPTDSAIWAKPNADSTFIVRAFNGFGCYSDDTVMLKVNARPAVSFGQIVPDSICRNDTAFKLTTGSPAGGIYSGFGVSLGKFNPAYTGPGIFTVKYTCLNALGCDNTASQTIKVMQEPFAFVNGQGSTSFCPGDSVHLTAPYGNYKYNWSNGDTLKDIYVKQGGNYTVKLTDKVTQCNSTSQPLTLKFKPQIVVTVSQHGDTLFASSTPPAMAWRWKKNGLNVPNNSNSYFVIDSSGYYYVQVTDTNGCVGNSAASYYLRNGISTVHKGLNEEGFMIYPNPSDGHFTLEIQDEHAVLNIYIYDALGKVVYQNKTNPGQGNSFDLKLPDGIYFILVGDRVDKLRIAN